MRRDARCRRGVGHDLQRHVDHHGGHGPVDLRIVLQLRLPRRDAALHLPDLPYRTPPLRSLHLLLLQELELRRGVRIVLDKDEGLVVLADNELP
eukprot:COSAG06_NODE_1013_length_11079_cov_7.729053_6_plen_94_part_00